MLEKIDVVHFSPAGNTRKAALLLAQAMAGRTEEYDLTRPHNTGRSFGPGDVVIVAGPVYGGRLPAVMLERLAEIQGNGAFAVTLAVYGNRAYEDALIELDDSVEKQGFRRLASAALAAQHSIVTQLAAGRPDQEDAEEITRFAEEILSKYEGTSGFRRLYQMRALCRKVPCGSNPQGRAGKNGSRQMHSLHAVRIHLPGKSQIASGAAHGRSGTEAGALQGHQGQK